MDLHFNPAVGTHHNTDSGNTHGGQHQPAHGGAEEQNLFRQVLQLNVYVLDSGPPYYHGNFVIADDKQATVGTSYFWRNQQDNLTTSSYEMGVVLGGEDAQEFIRQAEQVRQLTGRGERID